MDSYYLSKYRSPWIILWECGYVILDVEVAGVEKGRGRVELTVVRLGILVYFE